MMMTDLNDPKLTAFAAPEGRVGLFGRPCGTDVVTDAELIEQTLEIVSERCEDPAPDVFTRFFERCPEARPLFTVLDPSQPPLACGQMCFEVVQLLRDTAEGKPYVPSYMAQVAHSHTEIKVTDPRLYHEFLAALVDVMARLMAGDWTPAHAAAWARQCVALMQSMATPTSQPPEPGSTPAEGARALAPVAGPFACPLHKGA